MRGDRNSAHGAVESLAHLDIQNKYGRRALARFFQLLRTNASPDVEFSFLASSAPSKRHPKRLQWRSMEIFGKDATEALKRIGIRLDTEDQFDESMDASKCLNTYLNRILMLEPRMQNALFDAVVELYGHFVSVDRTEGSYDAGMESLDRSRRQRTSVSVVHREVLFKDPETGAETTYFRLRVDRGLTWEAASSLYEQHCDGAPEGFYRDSTGRVVLAVARASASRASRGADADSDDEERIFDLYRPHSGDLQVPHGDLVSGTRFNRVQDSATNRRALEQSWRQEFAAAGRWTEDHVLSGSILNTWAVVGSAVCGDQSYSRKAISKKLPLVRAALADGGAVVGIRVSPQHLNQVRYALSALASQSSRCPSASDARSAQELEARLKTETDTATKIEAHDIRDLSSRLEKFLEGSSQRSALWHGWAGAHRWLEEQGLVAVGASGMLAAQEAFDDLDRNGKLQLQADGTVHLLEKQKGNGWYVPPPKKPKVSRGRGRGRGRGGKSVNV